MMNINEEQVINKLAGELAVKSKELAYFKVATEQLESELHSVKNELQDLKDAQNKKTEVDEQ